MACSFSIVSSEAFVSTYGGPFVHTPPQYLGAGIPAGYHQTTSRNNMPYTPSISHFSIDPSHRQPSTCEYPKRSLSSPTFGTGQKSSKPEVPYYGSQSYSQNQPRLANPHIENVFPTAAPKSYPQSRPRHHHSRTYSGDVSLSKPSQQIQYYHTHNANIQNHNYQRCLPSSSISPPMSPSHSAPYSGSSSPPLSPFADALAPVHHSYRGFPRTESGLIPIPIGYMFKRGEIVMTRTTRRLMKTSSSGRLTARHPCLILEATPTHVRVLQMTSHVPLTEEQVRVVGAQLRHWLAREDSVHQDPFRRPGLMTNPASDRAGYIWVGDSGEWVPIEQVKYLTGTIVEDPEIKRLEGLILYHESEYPFRAYSELSSS